MDSEPDDYSDSGSDISENWNSGSDSSESDEPTSNRNTPFVWTVVEADQFVLSHDIVDFTGATGPIHPPEKDASPLEYFNILSANISNILVEETNRYARETLEREEDDLRPFSRMHKWEEVTLQEMSAFLGLWLAMGIARKPTLESYWSNGHYWLYNMPSFRKVMRRDRFELILKFLHANDNSTVIPRGQQGHDPAHKIRRILDVVNTTFKDAYNAGRDLTADESMVGFKGRNHIVQYLPAKKAHRWGAKLWVLAESDTGYTLTVDLYAGKRNTREQHHVNGLGFEVVTRLMEPYFGKHHHVVVDNAFNSPALCRDLFENNTYVTGTVRDSRKGMPRTFRLLKVPKGERVVRQSGPIMALKYGDRKNVTFLSTMTSPTLQTCTNGRGVELRIPNTVYTYNKFMGGVDTADQQIQTYDPDIKSVKMWKKILMNILLRVVDGKRKQCLICSSKVRTWCPDSGCSVGLCVGRCYEQYHTRLVNAVET